MKAEKHALWPALRSAACGGASRRCEAPSAAARALRATPPGRYAPSALRAHPFTNTKKKRFFRLFRQGFVNVVGYDSQLDHPVHNGAGCFRIRGGTVCALKLKAELCRSGAKCASCPTCTLILTLTSH